MELKKLCEGKMLPPVDIGKEHYQALFDLCVEAVSEATRVPASEILAKGRPRDVADARLMVYKMARHEIGIGDVVKYHDHRCPSFKWIAGKFGRTHGAVLHGVDRISLYLTIDRNLFDLYTKALSIYEISRAKYMSVEVKSSTDLQIHALQATIDTIKESIETHKSALEESERILEEAKGDKNENMVQEQCASNG